MTCAGDVVAAWRQELDAVRTARDNLDRQLGEARAVIREEIADALEEHAIGLRGDPFRRGDVGIEFICGIEDAAALVRAGVDVPRGHTDDLRG